ncbi:MAG: DNA primase [Candidatus Coatesbacteria bacterium]
MIDQATLDKIRAAVDIAEIVGEHVPLKRAGATSLKGLCPFHPEKTPSFHVNTALQIFKCFGCGAGGNAATFLMKIENIPFPEAVKRLAERAHIPFADTANPEEQERTRLRQLLETATSLYQRSLASSPAAARARSYLESRRIPKEAVAAFRLGFSTGQEVFAAKVHPALLQRAGLAGPGRDGSPTDRMRGRLVIPITDDQGRVVGFGGRALDDEQMPKYLNTPETPVFHKSTSLYGLSLAANAIRKAGRIVLVEGYFDVITLHALGVTETVASLGTSLTDGQLHALKRFARVLLIVYDEDMGGNDAAIRGLDLATEAGFEVKIVRLPGSKDPDEFILANGRDAFLRALEGAAGSEASDAVGGVVAVSLFDYRVEVASRHADPTTLRGKQAIVASVLPYLARVPNAIERHAYVRRLADHLQIREADVEEELAKVPRAQERPSFRPEPVRRTPAAAPASGWRAESLLLAGVLAHRPAAIQALFELPNEAFQTPDAARLAARMSALLQSGESFSVSSLMDEFQDSQLALDLLSNAEATEAVAVPASAGTAPAAPTAGGSDAACKEAAAHLTEGWRRRRLKDLQRQIEQARDPAVVARLLEAKQQLAGSTR